MEHILRVCLFLHLSPNKIGRACGAHSGTIQKHAKQCIDVHCVKYIFVLARKFELHAQVFLA